MSYIPSGSQAGEVRLVIGAAADTVINACGLGINREIQIVAGAGGLLICCGETTNAGAGPGELLDPIPAGGPIAGGFWSSADSPYYGALALRGVGAGCTINYREIAQ